MDIQCEKCQTVYTLSEHLIQPAGTPVRCTKCQHVFNAYYKADPNVPWTVKQTGGGVLRFDSVVSLQDAMCAQRIAEDDDVSRSGGPWSKAADLPEWHALSSSSPTRTPATPPAEAVLFKSERSTYPPTMAPPTPVPPPPPKTPTPKPVESAPPPKPATVEE
ncbi:MAG: zinc-ribbon domain-containing protein, partial [Proteobacteria bacterium]|nr:zinc-ribbon domain-containing protein [Pseudomonadota bacterium]